jgi:hypothetical protein
MALRRGGPRLHAQRVRKSIPLLYPGRPCARAVGQRASAHETNPQGLKPRFIIGIYGTIEVVPFHDGIKLTHYGPLL